VPTHESLKAASAAMQRALDAYEAWLTRAWSGALPNDACTSGANLLAEVIYLRQQWFPDTSLLMGELLIVHVGLSTILYDLQRQAIRGGGLPRPLSGPRAQPLIKKQIATIVRMRLACRLEEGSASICGPSEPA
jgi:hypothetical protein